MQSITFFKKSGIILYFVLYVHQCVYIHTRVYLQIMLSLSFTTVLFNKYVQFPFAPLTVIITAVWKSLPDNSDVRIITEWIMFFSGNILKILSCLFVSWGVVDSSALRMLGCGGLESVIFFPKRRKVCLKAPRNGLSLNCKFCLGCQVAGQVSALSALPCTPGVHWYAGDVTELARSPWTPHRGSLLSVAPCPGSPHWFLEQGLWGHH